jgi:hypothetical protein
MVTAADNLPSSDELDARALAILEAHWRPEGYCVPNADTYPFQWLWDSCFHAVVWSHLGRTDRAVAELRHLFRCQDDLGFVPHVDYEASPEHDAVFWGRSGSSSITQPPMYGHAVAELHRHGVTVPSDVVESATRGLRFLLDHRQRDAASGLVTIVHPWESGADDSPRWDDWAGAPFDVAKWYVTKGRLLDSIERSSIGSPLANPRFGAAPVGFNALLAFNARQLASVSGDDDLRWAADELSARLTERFDGVRDTWPDGGPASRGSGRVRTLDALLPVLIDPERAGPVLELAVDRSHYGGDTGPAGVHRDEPTFSARTYWRGPAWPQLTYLLWCAASDEQPRAMLAGMLVRGAVDSGFAEYWDPDDGTGLGAAPQSWTALAAVVAGSRPGEV